MSKNRVYGIEEVERLYLIANFLMDELGDYEYQSDEYDVHSARIDYYLVKAWRLLVSLKVKSRRGIDLWDAIGWDVHTIEGVGY